MKWTEITFQDPNDNIKYINLLISRDECISCQGFGQDHGTGHNCDDCIGTGKYSIQQKIISMKCFK